MDSVQVSGPPFDWSRGAGVFAVITFDVPVRDQPNRVLYDFGRRSGPRLTIFVNEEARLAGRATDSTGVSRDVLVSSPIPRGRPFLLIFEIEPRADGWVASFEVDGLEIATQAFDPPPDFDIVTEDQEQTYGGDLDGQHPAAFTLHSMGLLHSPMLAGDKTKLRAWAAQKYGTRR